jgi:hypothetical protein
MKIVINTINHKDQRVGEVGDYWEKDGTATFVISKMNKNYQALVILHELAEYFLVKKNKISLKAIDRFDKEFYENNNFGEAGGSKKSPYYNQHKFATKIEKMLAKELGISWNKYNKAVNSL